MTESIKTRVFAKLHELPDYYQDFDICTWGLAKEKWQQENLLKFLDAKRNATTEDVIDFQEWLEDRAEDARRQAGKEIGEDEAERLIYAVLNDML